MTAILVSTYPATLPRAPGTEHRVDVSLVADGLTVGVPMSAARARALAALLVKAADAAEAGVWTGEPWSVEP